jgi:ATP-binding cassette, subfamily C, bacterial CydCD
MRPFDRGMLPYLRAARPALLRLLAASLAQGVLVVVQAFAVAATIVAVVDGRSAAAPATVVACVFALRAAAAYVSDRAAAVAATRVSSQVRGRVLETALARGPVWLAGRRSGELVALATRGAAAVEPYLTRYLPALIVAATLPILTVVAMATQDLLSALIVLITLPLLPLFAALIGMTTRERAQRQWRELASLAGHFLDVVRGLPTLVAFRRARAQTRTISAATDRHRRATMATLRLAFASSAALELVATLSVALVAVVVGLRLDAGRIALEPALVVLLLAPEAYWPIRKVGAEFHAAAEGTATFAAAADVVGDAHAGRVDLSSRPATTPRRPPAIAVRGLQVRYPGADGLALDLPAAHLQPTGLNVIVGPSGSGKSTLVMALLGFVEPESGQIQIEGPDAPHDLGADWRRQVAWMPQRPWFAAGSIADNLRLGRQSASDAELWEALGSVGLAGTVASLPGGLGADLAEDGRSLSAGQRARVALARVMVSGRPVVIVDEPTAHLDDVTQQLVIAALLRLSERALVVVVSHREELVDAAETVIRISPPAALESAPMPARPAAARSTAAVDSPATRTTQRPTAATLVDRLPSRLRLPLAALLGSLAAACGVALTATSGWLIVRASERPPVLSLLVAIVGVRTFGLGRPLLRYAERLVAHDTALRTLASARVRTYDALIPLTPGRLGRRRGHLLASVVDDVDAVVERPVRVVLPAASAVVVGAATAAGAAVVSGLAGAVVAGLVGAAACSFVLTAAAHHRLGPVTVDARADLMSSVADVLDGAGEIELWTSSRAAASVAPAETTLAAAEMRAARHVAAARAVLTVAVGAATGAIALIAAGMSSQGELSPAVAALVVLLPLGIAEVLSPLPDAGALEPHTRAALARLRRLEHLEPAVQGPRHAIEATGPEQLRVTDAVVSWGDRHVLSGITLDARPGHRTAVVGPSGSGKSTLAALVARNIDPRSGSVEFRGADLRAWSLDAVRTAIGLVDDDPHVFGSTVYENVRLARPSATRDDVRDALRRARLDTWVDSLPRGLDTVIGDGGFEVSGGERARLAVARAVLAQPEVLVLDEPTSHLDGATAREVLDEVLDAWADRPIIVATHRAADVDCFDEVVALGRASRSDL